ncbi:MAG: hypothetical protein ACKVT0_14705 [Planctomycetaceae bacterium]
MYPWGEMQADRRSAANTLETVRGFWGCTIDIGHLLPWGQQPDRAEIEQENSDGLKGYFEIIRHMKPLGEFQPGVVPPEAL